MWSQRKCWNSEILCIWGVGGRAERQEKLYFFKSKKLFKSDRIGERGYFIGRCFSKTRCLRTRELTWIQCSKFGEKEVYLKWRIPFHKITICEGLGFVMLTCTQYWLRSEKKKQQLLLESCLIIIQEVSWCCINKGPIFSLDFQQKIALTSKR